tara:strand:- start:618 stop:1130 length:513 start_codon:yes stop_codon:yes gene_type:complete
MKNITFTLAEKNFVLANLYIFNKLNKEGRLGHKAKFIFNYILKDSSLVYKTKEDFLKENKEYSNEGDVTVMIEDDGFGRLYRTIYYQGRQHDNSGYLHFPMRKEGVKTGSKSGSWSEVYPYQNDAIFTEMSIYSNQKKVEKHQVQVHLTNWRCEGEIEISSKVVTLKKSA